MSSYFGGGASPSTAADTPKESPAPMRFQRKMSTGNAPSIPPPSVPPPESSASEAEESEPRVHEPTKVSTLKREDKERKERMERERKELESRRIDNQHEQLEHRGSYVEEPPSTTTTLDRRGDNEKALVQRITNEMAMATYVHQVDIPANGMKHAVGAYTPGVYRIRSLRFFELALRRCLWGCGKFIANRCVLSTCLALLCFIMALALPAYNRDYVFVDTPFEYLFVSQSDSLSNGVGLTASSGSTNTPSSSKSYDFNYTNPAFRRIRWRNPNMFAVLLKTDSPRDTILRKDAVLAYSSLKKKLDHFPVEKREFLVTCANDCETDKDMVDRIIRKSPQVALTYPETFVSLSKDSNNLTRIYLGHAIGGVETDTDGAISKATSLLMTFELRDDLTANELLAWNRHFDEQVRLTSAPNLTILAWSPETFRSNVVSTIHDQYNWLLASAIIVLILCVLATLASNSYKSKPCVGLMIFVALIISSITGASMQFYRNAPVDPLVYPICFVTIGVGLVWLLQLHKSWSRYSSAAVHPTEKIAFILAHDGPGIAASATILVITFVIMGCLVSHTHMISTFIGIASSIAILFIFSILFVSVFVFISGRREARGVKWFQWFKTGDTHFTAPQLAAFDSSALFSLHDRLLDTRASMSRAIGAFLVSRTVRYPLVFFCAVYLMLAIIGCLQTRVEIRDEHFVPASSPQTAFIQQYGEQYGRASPPFIELTFDTPIDYHDQDVQSSIFDLLDSAVNNGDATRSISWLTEFTKFEKASIYDVNQDTFVPVVNLVFLASDTYRKFGADIVMDRYQTQIIKSRMYLELTPAGYERRCEVVETLLDRATTAGIPVTISLPQSSSLRHDISILSSGLYAFGIALVSLLVVSILVLGQPALTFLLIFTSICVLVETIGYAYYWSVPINAVTLTMALAGNALTCTIVIAFCYSYSMSGRSQIRAGIRVQYTFQATFVPVLFSVLLPVLSYTPLLFVDVPIVLHIFKIIVINAAASFIHYLIFLPNLMLLLSENVGNSCMSSLNCAECCCDIDDESSIYYIPTGGRAIHPEAIYPSAYGYAVQKPMITAAAPPPHYLAIAGPPANPIYAAEYGQMKTRHSSRRTRRHSEVSNDIQQEIGDETPRDDRRRRKRQTADNSEIYEAPPSPLHNSNHNHRTASSPRRQIRRANPPDNSNNRNQSVYDDSWRPYVPPSPYGIYQSRR